jgi:hypothetical protein
LDLAKKADFGTETSQPRKLSPSLHRSQIFRKFVSDAGSGSGILRLRRTIPLLFWREDFKDSLFQLSFIFLN